MSAKAALFVLLAVVGVAFCAFWARQARAKWAGWPNWLQLAIGALTDFFDTLGVGSFATTTSLFKLKGIVEDAKIPGTLNVGHMVPTFAQAFIYIAVVKVDMSTLILMIGAAVAGAYLGAGFVSKWPRRRIQIGMGVLLLVAAGIIVARVTGFVPGGGTALGLEGPRLAIGLVGNFILGSLMTLGIGLYAPCMILVSFLGMNDDTAFPIMMGSCAFLMPAASVPFVRSGRYDLRAALGLTIAGTPAVLIAAFIVKSLPLKTVKWLVVAVVVYTAIAMLRSATRETASGAAQKERDG
jgi:uncharacterized membrane protein YfcA